MKRPTPPRFVLAALLTVSCTETSRVKRAVPKPTVAAAPTAPAAPGVAAAPVLLLSGFGPFADVEVNVSWQVAERLDGEVICGMRVVAVKLPVVWDEARDGIRAAVKEHGPAAAICLGVGRPGWIDVETLARNRRVDRKDALGRRPELLVVEQGGPPTVPTRLPVERIVERIRELGVAVRTSTDAGGYLCNEAFYAILRATAESSGGESIPAGFIHLPLAQPEGRSGRAAKSEHEAKPVSLDELVRAVRAAIEETAAVCEAVPAAGAR
jgi:pyroglutamyl-peptidase